MTFTDWPYGKAAPPEPPSGPEYFLGLDLGQSTDFSALAVVTRERATAEAVPTFRVDHLERWQRGTSYPAIVADVGRLVKKPPLKNPILGIDETGVGRAVLDLFRVADPPVEAQITPFLVHGGRAVTKVGNGWHLPKAEMASCLQALLQDGRLTIAKVSLRETLKKELTAFRVKVTAAGNETFEAWRESDHDDLVFAVGIACWLAARGKRRFWYAT